MYQFKKGFDALDEAFSTIPYVKNAITEFKLKNGEDDFDSDYVIVIGFHHILKQSSELLNQKDIP